MISETGFLRADGTRIRDGQGNDVLLRGVGLGNWLLPEGYMWRFKNPADRPRRIEAMFGELVGPERNREFWHRFRDRYTTEEDIRQIAAEGFNSIRIPINWGIVMDPSTGEALESGYALIDRCIDWCRTHNVYAILDLHGAPGGQTGTNIDDCENDHPDLYATPRYRQWNIWLWQTMAARYVDEPVVAAYDLLNEPVPDQFSQYHTALADVYREVTAAIREVDRNHIVMYEGANWATNFTMINERFDDNFVLQFHKYWNRPDPESLEPYLAKQTELGAPLYMGEGGENAESWMTGAFQLLDDYGIGWNLWPWKKIDTLTSPCSIKPPAGWDLVQEYVTDRSKKPDAETAWKILDEYLANIELDRCEYRTSLIDAILRRVPFAVNAEFYGYRGSGVSYQAVGEKEKQAVELRAGDGIRIENVMPGVTAEPNYWTRPQPEDQNVCIVLEAGEWVVYEFNLMAGSAVAAQVELQSIDGAELWFAVDGAVFDKRKVVGDWQSVESRLQFPIAEGRHELRVECAGGSVRVDWVKFTFAAL